LTNRWLGALVLAALAVGLASLGLSLAPLIDNSGGSGAPGSTDGVDLVPGIYSDGPNGQPHFYVIIDHVRGQQFTGSMNIRYEDGQAAVLFDFVAQGVRSDATARATTVAEPPPDELTARPPSSMSVTVGMGQIAFGECSSYLQVQSPSECRFKASRGA